MKSYNQEERYPGINVTKEVKDVYSGNQKTLKLKMTQMER